MQSEQVHTISCTSLAEVEFHRCSLKSADNITGIVQAKQGVMQITLAQSSFSNVSDSISKAVTA